MKTIIVATDFSSYGHHAAHYAAALAQAAETRLVLFHFSSIPVPATDLPVFYSVSDADISAEALRRLEALKEELLAVYDIEIDYQVRYLDLLSDLEDLYREMDASLVVMGRRVRNPVTGALFGSVAARVVRSGKVPVLLVPPEASFRPVRKILFACDTHHVDHPETLSPLTDLALEFNAYIDVQTFVDFEKMPAQGKPPSDSLETLLQSTRHGYVYPTVTPDLPEEILYQAVRADAEIVAVIPHHHSRWAGLFQRSVSQEMAAETGLPLLALAERVRTHAGQD